MKRTKLYDMHKNLHGRMVEFAGWEMPVDYGSILKEHEAVRNHAGIFDVSHMGEFFFRGTHARAAISWLISNIVPKVESKRCVYSGLLNEAGCFIDDIIAGMLSDQHGFMVVNAANEEKDFKWVSEQVAKRREEMNWDVSVTNVSADYGLLAVQGKMAIEQIQKVFPKLESMRPFSIFETDFEGTPIVITFTGYTGEAGVEVMVPDEKVEAIFDAFIQLGVKPCGLGARDSLRLEKGYSLYGNEIDETTNAWEAGLGWTVKLKKEAFIGRDSLVQLHEQPAQVTRKMVGLLVEGTIPVRSGAKIFDSDAKDVMIGTVTSGIWSPTLKKPIALGYVRADETRTEVMLDWRNRLVPARVVERVFV